MDKHQTIATVGEARDDERSTILDITLTAYREYENDSVPGFWEKYCQNIRQAILQKTSTTILVVRDQDSIKASVLLCEPATSAFVNPHPEMRLLAVLPEYRNLGLGNLLIEECERRAARSGVLTLHTTSLMKTARAMYERRGYVRYSEIDFEPVPGFVVWGYKKFL